MNGAVQGEATITASTPVAKLPRQSPFRVRPLRGLRIGDAAAERELVDAEQVQPDQEEQHRQGRDDPGRLQLEAPAECVARLLERDQRPGEQQEGQHHATGEGDAVHGQRARMRAVLREADQFQRQHREHARHQVQDQPAKERGPQCGDQ